MSATVSNEEAASNARALVQLASGCWVSQALHVAARLGIADLLVDGPRSPAELAQTTRTDAGALYRVLRALASVSVFAEDEEGRFALTPLAEGLRADAPASMRAFIMMMGEDWHWRAWGELLESVRTGQSAFEHVFGCGLFAYFAARPEAARVFDAAMTSRTDQEKAAVLAAYDWPAGTIVDVGGGVGALLAAILARRPDAHGVLFDLPHVTTDATERIEQAGVSQRCKVVAGDFFQEVPPGGDLYLLKGIIHDWDDQHALAILRNCRAAIADGGRLLVIGHVLAPGNAPSWGKLLDLEMLVMTHGGRERSEVEYRALLRQAGFELERVIPTASITSLIEAVPGQPAR